MYGRAARDLAGLLHGSDFQRGKATKLLAQVDAISKRLGEASDAWSMSNAERAALDGAAWADGELRRIGEDIGPAALGGDFVKVNERAVGVFATQIARDLAIGHKDMADSARRIISTTQQQILADPEMSELIGRGLVGGGNLNKIARGLRARLTEAGREALESGKLTPQQLEDIADLDAGYVRAGKARIKLTRYCQMVASFQLRQANVHATKLRLGQAGEALGEPDRYDLVVVQGPISGDYCDFYVGKVFSISGSSSEFPPLSSIPNGGPPFHPNCTHSISPFIRRFATGREVERGKINERFLNIDGRKAQKRYMSNDRAFAARREETGQNSRSSRAEPVKP